MITYNKQWDLRMVLIGSHECYVDALKREFSYALSAKVTHGDETTEEAHNVIVRKDGDDYLVFEIDDELDQMLFNSLHGVSPQTVATYTPISW